LRRFIAKDLSGFENLTGLARRKWVPPRQSAKQSGLLEGVELFYIRPHFTKTQKKREPEADRAV
jgi:hypothetical protein